MEQTSEKNMISRLIGFAVLIFLSGWLLIEYYYHETQYLQKALGPIMLEKNFNEHEISHEQINTCQAEIENWWKEPSPSAFILWGSGIFIARLITKFCDLFLVASKSLCCILLNKIKTARG